MKVFLEYDIPETGAEIAGLAKFAMEKHMEREKYSGNVAVEIFRTGK